jgi:hypothetical protein
MTIQDMYDNAITTDDPEEWKALAMRLWLARKPRKRQSRGDWPPPAVQTLFADGVTVTLGVFGKPAQFWQTAARVAIGAWRSRAYVELRAISGFDEARHISAALVPPAIIATEIVGNVPTWYRRDQAA